MENEVNDSSSIEENALTELPSPEVEVSPPPEEPLKIADTTAGAEVVKESNSHNLNPLLLGFTIALVFILGLALGFFGRPVVIKDLPIEVVVTVVPGENQAVAQTAVQANEANPAESQTNAPSEVTSDPGNEVSDGPGQPTPTIMDFVLSDARHFQGNEAANVTVIEFSDFNCHFCGKFFTETLNQLRTDYVDTGKVRFAYKHFAILGPDSTRAAEASECAAEQDKFWAYHDSVFYNRVSGQADLSDQSLIAQAANLELDMDRFSECLESDKYANQINQEALSVQSMGVKGTPAFLINGVFISGAQPYEVFQQVIDEQLASLEN